MLLLMMMLMMMMMIYLINHVTGILVESLSFVRRLVKIYVKGNLSIRIIVRIMYMLFIIHLVTLI